MKFILDDFHRNVPNEELIADLKNVASILKANTITMNEYNTHGKFHSTTLTRRFGSWFTCLKMAGLEQSRAFVNIPEQDLMDDIERVWILLGKQPSYSQMQIHTKYSIKTYENRFGGWRKALEYFIQYINKPDDDTVLERNENYSVCNKTSRTINQRLRFFVLARDNFSCCACGASPAKDGGITVLHVDHIIPWSLGGKTTMDNLQTLCDKCNLGKSNLKV